MTAGVLCRGLPLGRQHSGLDSIPRAKIMSLLHVVPEFPIIPKEVLSSQHLSSQVPAFFQVWNLLLWSPTVNLCVCGMLSWLWHITTLLSCSWPSKILESGWPHAGELYPWCHHPLSEWLDRNMAQGVGDWAELVCGGLRTASELWGCWVTWMTGDFRKMKGL